jgi:S-disulfanyl-L-cysteine oxidoreductase SoxD
MKTPALILLASATLAAATLFAQGQTTADGVGTAEQARRGGDVYQAQCAACHDAQLAGSGTAPALAGTDFAANWKDETVASLFERIRATMPADNPGSLKRDQVADLVSFILNFNKYPTSQKELGTEFEALKAIKITAPK